MLTSNIRPLRAQRRARLSSATVIRVPAAGDVTRILIVDQDRQVGVTLSFMLSARRYEEVRAVRSAKRALAITEQFRPEIVFLDLELPEEGGFTVARQLASHQRSLRPRLIALTTTAEHPARAELRAAGFERIITKPVSHDELDKVLGIVHPPA